MKLKEIDNQDGTHEYHQVGCKHGSKFIGCFIDEVEVEASNLAELCHQLELGINQDFASDEGVTVEEFLAEGNGYRVSTSKDAEFRVFPCVKF